MEIERKIYNSWAFSDNFREKGKMNHRIYKEDLEPKSKQFWGDNHPTEEDKNSFMCYKKLGIGYGNAKFEVLSNPHNFTTLEQALICDSGNLCFGYRVENGMIVIYTD